jgi:putative endonuclease
MASVYILYSQLLNRYYVGSCKELDARIHDHLFKYFPDAYTAKATDWILFFTINDLSYSQARKIEIHIKKMRTHRYIQSLKKYPELVAKITDKFR